MCNAARREKCILNNMDGSRASLNKSFRSSNNFTNAQVLPSECANEVEKTYPDGHPALYLAPSTLRALKVNTEIKPVTTALDAFFKKSFTATQDNLNSWYFSTSVQPQTQPPTIPATPPMSRSPTPQPMRTESSSDQQKNSEARKTVIVCPVESGSLASNEQQVQCVRHDTNPCTNECTRARDSIMARESFTTCLCPIWDGVSRDNLEPIPDSNHNHGQFTIPGVLSSHQKYLIQCYPELSFMGRVPHIPEIVAVVDPALYCKFILNQLNTHTYPPYPRLCSALNYARDVRLRYDSSSSDEEETVLVIDSEWGRLESRNQTAPYTDPMNGNSKTAHFSQPESSGSHRNSAVECAQSQMTDDTFLLSSRNSTITPNESVDMSDSSDVSSEDQRPPCKVMKFH